MDEASAAVRAARRRLLVRTAAEGAARGLLAGAVLGGAAWAIAIWTRTEIGEWPLAAPLLGAIAGAAMHLRLGVSFDVAALTLDAAAGTDEAFISSMSARDASPEIRALSAQYAVERCPRRSVGKVLPVRTPGIAASALVATALLVAAVAVHRLRVPPPSQSPIAGGDDAAAMAGGSAVAPREVSPRNRIEQFTRRVGDGGASESTSLAAEVRRDLGAVSNDQLRRLAEALAASPSTADAAKRALAALDRGDRSAATDALREALGGGRSVPSAGGTGRLAAAPESPASRAPWSAPTWPLRYDRVVRRWLDETAAAEAGKK